MTAIFRAQKVHVCTLTSLPRERRFSGVFITSARNADGSNNSQQARKTRSCENDQTVHQKLDANRLGVANKANESVVGEYGDVGEPAYTDGPAGIANSVGSLLLLISPFFFWGTSMVAMKALSPHTAPLFVSAVRMLPAGCALLLWASLDKRPQPQGLTAWLWIAVFGFADATCFQGFLAEGLQRTSAGLGSIIIDSQPLSVAIMASILFRERLTAAGYMGLAVGVLGLCCLELPPDTIAKLLNGAGQQQSVSTSASLWDSGEWWMLLAAQSMAVGTVLVRYVSKYADPVVATGYHMLLGGLPLALLSIQQEGQQLAERLPLLTGLDYLLLAFISLLGSAASYGVFFLNASRGNLTTLSSLTFLTPCFAAATGYVFFGETLSMQQLIGAGITLGGVYFISGASAQ